MGQIRQEFESRTKSSTATNMNEESASVDSPSSSHLLLLQPIMSCHIRSSFTLEILSFCVRAHIHRMKFFLLKTRLLGAILKSVLCNNGCNSDSQKKKASDDNPLAGVRCLKLASLK